MYIPTYKQAVLFIVGLVLFVATIVKVTHIHEIPHDAIIRPGDVRVPSGYAVSMLLPKTKQMLLSDSGRCSLPTCNIWYSWNSYEDWRRAKSVLNASAPAIRRFLKYGILWDNGTRYVASLLWYLSQDESRFAQFRTQRIGSYDEELEKSVAKSMVYTLGKILKMSGSFIVTTEGRRNIRMFRTGNNSGVSFDVPSIRTLADFKSLSIIITDKGLEINENVWIHQVWHAMRVMFPALKELNLSKGEYRGRDLTAEEMVSVGRCVGMKKLRILGCVGMEEMWHLNGSTVGGSIDTLVLKDLRLSGLDIDTIGGFSMRGLFFYRTVKNAYNYNLAGILEQKLLADRLTRLYITFVDDIDISSREANAISSLRNVQFLSLNVEKSECCECIFRILDSTPISAGLNGLALATSSISPSDFDVIANLRINFLSISCIKVTGEHLSRIGAGMAGLQIMRLEIRNADVSTIFRGITAFRNLRSLKLERYTASAWPWSDLTTIFAEHWPLRRLELFNKKLLPLPKMVASEKADLEELVLSIDELTELELSAILWNKHKLKTLEIIGGNVTGSAVPVIMDLHNLTSLRIVDANMAYSDLTILIGNGNLQRKMGRRFRLHVKMPHLDEHQVGDLCRYGLDYKDGVFVL